jgi:hypothetical protein
MDGYAPEKNIPAVRQFKVYFSSKTLMYSLFKSVTVFRI